MIFHIVTIFLGCSHLNKYLAHICILGLIPKVTKRNEGKKKIFHL